MTSPSNHDLTPSAEKVSLYLDYDDQQIVIGALLLTLQSSKFNKERLLDCFPDYDRNATAEVFETMTDKVNAIIARLR